MNMLPAILLAALDRGSAAYQSGYQSGRVVAPLLLLIGILVCAKNYRREGTNKKCTVSLLLVLLGWMIPSLTSLLAGTGPEFKIIAILAGLLCLAIMGAAVVLGVWGLIEYYSHRDRYRRGSVAAITSLVLTALLGAIVLGGAIRGFQRSREARLHVLKDQPQAGDEVVMEELNFRLRVPARPWVRMDAKKLNPVASVAFLRTRPQVYFMVIAEDFGGANELDSRAVLEVAKAGLLSAATRAETLEETTVVVGGIAGWQMDTRARVVSKDIYYVHRVAVTNGYAYQLIFWGGERDGEAVRQAADEVAAGFSLVDPLRISGGSGEPAPRNHASERFGYKVALKEDWWQTWQDLAVDMPEAEYGVLGRGSGPALMVVPICLFDSDANLEATTRALLSTMNILRSDTGLSEESSFTNGPWKGRAWNYRCEIEGVDYTYRLQIVQGGDFAYLIGTWDLSSRHPESGFLEDILENVQLPENPPPSLHPAQLSAEELRTHSLFMNEAGLFYMSSRQYDDAARLFGKAMDLDDSDPVILENLLLACSRIGQFERAYSYLTNHTSVKPPSQSLQAWEAFLLSQLDRPTEALETYRSLFESGYRADEDFSDYLDLLAEHQGREAALTNCESYLASQDSLAIRLEQAALLSATGDSSNALRILVREREKHPNEPRVLYSLTDQYLEVDRNREALDLCQEMATLGYDSSYTAYLKGRAEYGLGWYREAKESMEEALDKSPEDSQAKLFLDHISGLLGEGSNSAIKNPIPAVQIPESLLSELERNTADPAEGYDARYQWYRKAIRFEKGAELRSTEQFKVQVLNPAGVASFSTLEVSLDPLAEEVFVNALVVRDGAGGIVATGEVSNYYILDQPADGMATQDKQLHIPVPGLEPGHTVECSVTRRKLATPDTFPFRQELFAHAVPVQTDLVYLEGDLPGIIHRESDGVRTLEGSNYLAFCFNSPPVWRYEPLQPSNLSHLPGVWMCGEEESWPELARDYLDKIQDRLKPDPLLVQVATQQVAPADSSETEKALRLARYVQKAITYKAIEFGKRAIIPVAADRVLANKYGDCKDHALLLKQLCGAAGIEAHLALINTDEDIRTDLPSIDQFNHMIVYLPGVETGRFIDCTSKHEDLTLPVPRGLAGRSALVLDPEDPRFVTLAEYPAEASRILCEREVVVDEEMTARVEEVQTITGYYAASLRSWFTSLQAPERRETYQRILASVEPGIVLKSLAVDQLDSPSEPFVLSMSYSIPGRFKSDGGRIFGRLPFIWERYALATPAVASRANPFELGPPMMFKSRTILTTPASCTPPETAPFAHQTRHPDFASSSKATVESGRLEVDFDCRRGSGIRPAGLYQEYQQAAETSLRAIEQNFSFGPTAP